MKFLALLVLAGVLAAPAVAAPDGFRDSARLATIATGLVGHPVYVRCAATETVWAAMLAPWKLTPDVDGLTFPDNAGSYLSPRTCRPLEGWLRGKGAPTPVLLGTVALTLVHETEHMRGIDGESEADCAALKELPGVLRRSFGIRKAATLRTVMQSAWANHRRRPAEYRALC